MDTTLKGFPGKVLVSLLRLLWTGGRSKHPDEGISRMVAIEKLTGAAFNLHDFQRGKNSATQKPRT